MNPHQQLNELIFGLHRQGKTDRQIAVFLDCDIRKVSMVTDPYSQEKMQEARRNALIKYQHREKAPQRVRQFISPHAQERVEPLAERGNFLETPAGQEAIERLCKPYEATGRMC